MPATKCITRRTCRRVGIVAQRIETSLHAGTHFDGAMHATDGRSGDMASLPLDYLVNQGVVVDLAPQVTDWSAITPEMIEKSGADIREGDILILHTGWHRYYEGQSRQDLVRYFCYHPGPTFATLEWMLKKKIKWFGMDTGSCDHPMNTSIRTMRPDIAREFEQVMGKKPADYFGTFEYVHKRSGRKVRADVFPVPQLRVPGRAAARRESGRRSRKRARQALHHRRLSLAL